MKKIFTEDNIQFDSHEELVFYRWCKEAEMAGYLERFEYHPKPLKLSGRIVRRTQKILKAKIKTIDKFLLHPHEYTLDFVLYPTVLFERFKHGLVEFVDNVYYIDVKGGFNLYNNHRDFSINQKWVYEKFGIYVNKVEPKKFFAKTWTPGSARKQSTLKGVLAECLTGK